MGAAINIAVLANASQAKAELASVETTAQKIGGGFKKMAVPAVAALGALAVGAKGAVDAASDVNEEVSKSGEIFGGQAAGIEKFANGAAKSLGQSKAAALDATSTFGQIGQKAGLAGGESAKFAKQFTVLSSDLASFNNTSPEEAIEAIGSAMRGEAEPIRKFGVMLDDATLKARAMKMGLIETTTQALTPQQKALAASQEILAQTGKAQGDFARTSDGVANKQRIQAATAEDLKAKLGQGLLPAYQKLQEVMISTLGWISENTGKVQILVGVIAGLAVGVLAVNAVMAVAGAVSTVYGAITGATAVATGVQTAAQWALNAALSANPIALVILAVVALVAVLVIAWQHSDTFREKVTAAWNAIKQATGAVWDWVKEKIAAVFGFLKNLFFNFTGPGLIIKHWDTIKTATLAAWNAVKDYVSDKLGAAKERITTIGGNAKDALVTAWETAKTKTAAAWDRIKDIITEKIDAFMGTVRGIKDRVVGVFSSAGSWLYNAGRSIVQGLLDGVNALIDTVLAKFKSLTDKIPKVKGPPARDRKLLSENGRFIMLSLVDGLEDGIPGVLGTLGDLTRRMAGFDAVIPAGFTLADPGTGTIATTTRGGNTYRIDVTVPVGASSADIGRELTKHIGAFERAGGRRPA